jgi:hypothetical protein
MWRSKKKRNMFPLPLNGIKQETTKEMFASDNFELKLIAFELREFLNNLNRSLIYTICGVV